MAEEPEDLWSAQEEEARRLDSERRTGAGFGGGGPGLALDAASSSACERELSSVMGTAAASPSLPSLPAPRRAGSGQTYEVGFVFVETQVRDEEGRGGFETTCQSGRQQRGEVATAVEVETEAARPSSDGDGDGDGTRKDGAPLGGPRRGLQRGPEGEGLPEDQASSELESNSPPELPTPTASQVACGGGGGGGGGGGCVSVGGGVGMDGGGFGKDEGGLGKDGGGGGGLGKDAGGLGKDAGGLGKDGGGLGKDAGGHGKDAGGHGKDAGDLGKDRGGLGKDAGSVEEDGGSVEEDGEGGVRLSAAERRQLQRALRKALRRDLLVVMRDVASALQLQATRGEREEQRPWADGRRSGRGGRKRSGGSGRGSEDTWASASERLEELQMEEASDDAATRPCGESRGSSTWSEAGEREGPSSTSASLPSLNDPALQEEASAPPSASALERLRWTAPSPPRHRSRRSSPAAAAAAAAAPALATALFCAEPSFAERDAGGEQLSEASHSERDSDAAPTKSARPASSPEPPSPPPPPTAPPTAPPTPSLTPPPRRSPKPPPPPTTSAPPMMSPRPLTSASPMTSPRPMTSALPMPSTRPLTSPSPPATSPVWSEEAERSTASSCGGDGSAAEVEVEVEVAAEGGRGAGSAWARMKQYASRAKALALAPGPSPPPPPLLLPQWDSSPVGKRRHPRPRPPRPSARSPRDGAASSGERAASPECSATARAPAPPPPPRRRNPHHATPRGSNNTRLSRPEDTRL